MKCCKKCRRTLPVDDFYVHSMMADGRLNFCKECVKARVRARHAQAPEVRWTYDQRRRLDPQRKELNARVTSAWKKEHKKEVCAQVAVHRALKKGLITKQPCWVCGAERSLAHHPDYDAPLSVVWLCEQHHRATHALVKVSENT